jgi:hypothetical protein
MNFPPFENRIDYTQLALRRGLWPGGRSCRRSVLLFWSKEHLSYHR